MATKSTTAPAATSETPTGELVTKVELDALIVRLVAKFKIMTEESTALKAIVAAQDTRLVASLQVIRKLELTVTNLRKDSNSDLFMDAVRELRVEHGMTDDDKSNFPIAVINAKKQQITARRTLATPAPMTPADKEAVDFF